MQRNDLFQEFVNHMHAMDEILFKLTGQKSDKTDLLMELASEHGFKPIGVIVKDAEAPEQWSEEEIANAIGDISRHRAPLEFNKLKRAGRSGENSLIGHEETPSRPDLESGIILQGD